MTKDIQEALQLAEKDPRMWLWIDPFLNHSELKKRVASGAVLLAEDIIRYVNTFSLLFDKTEFSKGKLKGASYTMTPHPTDAWMFNEKGEEVRLRVEEDPQQEPGRFFLVPKHSLVYIKLKQSLRIPFYLIGRHNLKIRYVYQGLLLGTGPQVDPGYEGNLFIPLHNFTTREARLYIDQSFVSIDFVRTTFLEFGEEIPTSYDELYIRYKEEKHLLEQDKLKRESLRDYLGGKKPQSAMQEILESYRLTTDELATLKENVGTMVAQVKDSQHGTREALDIAGQHSEHMLERLEDKSGALEQRVHDRTEAMVKERRVDMFVLLGVMFAIVGIVLSGFVGVWAIMRDNFGDLDGKLFLFEKRVSAWELGATTNLADGIRNDMSNSFMKVVNSSESVTGSLARLESRIKDLETQARALNQRIPGGNTNATPAAR